MDTQLASWAQARPEALEAQAILQRCVHCGFCTATCPTYRVLGDERDSPRGRIYLIKQMLEGASTTEQSQAHLDRCLTCRNCETTCPSGVQYGRLVDLGRGLMEERVPRAWPQRALRWALREGLTSPLFGPALALGRLLRPLLPGAIRAKVTPSRPAGAVPRIAADSPIQSTEFPSSRLPAVHAQGLVPQRLILPRGCVQPSLLPSIDAATQRVLADLRIATVSPPDAGCCGALKHHLADHAGSTHQMQRNTQTWHGLLVHGEAQGVLMNASGCAVMVAEYGHLLKETSLAAEAAAVSAAMVDPIQLLLPHAERLARALAPRAAQWGPMVYHPPCTQQHGLKIRGQVEHFLRQLGVQLLPVADAHLCCGSAGTYAVLQPEMSKTLRHDKLKNLEAGRPSMILSANIGCLTHLESGTATPVRHWLEWLDAELSALAQAPEPGSPADEVHAHP